MPLLNRSHWLKRFRVFLFLWILLYSSILFARTPLDGSWSSTNDSTILFQGSQYQLYESGQIVDKGTFQIQGNVLTTQSESSGAEEYIFQCRDDFLKLQDADGAVFQFSRSVPSPSGKITGVNPQTQGMGQPQPQLPAGQMPPSQHQGAATGPGTPAEIMNFIAGTWKDIRSSGHTIIEIRTNGTFSYYSDSAASGDYSNQYGKTGSWGYGSQNSTQGQWQARGTPQRGTIHYQSQSGEQGTLDYQVMIENGRAFRNECYFDGTLYQRQ